jgi:hypothetical protein
MAADLVRIKTRLSLLPLPRDRKLNGHENCLDPQYLFTGGGDVAVKLHLICLAVQGLHPDTAALASCPGVLLAILPEPVSLCMHQ